MHVFLRPRADSPSTSTRQNQAPSPRWAICFYALVYCVGLGLGSPAAMALTPAKEPLFLRVPSLEEEVLFEVLTGEMELRRGQPELAMRSLASAARKTKNDALFQRSTEIALQWGQGVKPLEAALGMAQSWQSAMPHSNLAPRYVVDILLRLGRGTEAIEPMTRLLKSASVADRVKWISEIPRIFGTAGQPEKMARLLQTALKPYADTLDTGVAVDVALGRLWLNAKQYNRAFEHALKAHQLDPSATDPAILAIELLSLEPTASMIVDRHLEKKPSHIGLRMVYARALSLVQRHTEAISQLTFITQSRPDLPAPWLILGALHLDLSHAKEAIIAFQTHLDRLNNPSKPAPLILEGLPEATVNFDDQDRSLEENRQKTWLLLAQAAEQLGDQASAQAWLDKVDDPRLVRDVVERQVAILAKQGKVEEARQRIQNLGSQQADDRTKVLLEAFLLREAKNWPEAQKVLRNANERISNDTDLLYEQAMVEEKLNKLGPMEHLLRHIIRLKPDHYNALNALGYTLADRGIRLPEAKRLIQQALQWSPQNPFILDSMGWVEFRMGNHKEALRLLRLAYKSRPDTEINAHLGEVLWVMGQRQEALQIWREGLKRDPQNQLLQATLMRLKVKP